MKNKILITVIMILVTGSQMSVFAQEVTKEDVSLVLEHNVTPMMEFLMKYDKENAKNPNQVDFDKMLNEMGIMNDIQNDRSGLTKEDAFNFVNAYIQADRGEKGVQIVVDQDKKDKVADFLRQLEEGKKDAQSVFDEVITEDKVNEFVKQAEAEIAKFQTSGFGISYEDFKKEAKKKKPNATEVQIQKAYKDLMKQFGF